MDDKQLLDAIQSIVENVVQKETSELREELRGEMETRFGKQSEEMEAQFTSIDGRFSEIDNRLNSIDNQFSGIGDRFTSLESQIERQHTESKALHENTFDRIKNLLQEDYERIAEAAAKGAAVAESHNELQSTVNTHDKVLHNHNERLSMLEEKAI